MGLAILATLFSVVAIAAMPPASGGVPRDAGLYVGYYQEDPVNNPEDPTMGTLYLSLPPNDGHFAGSMYFTYVGCQTSNVGRIDGAKAGVELQGTWQGSLDGTEQHGTFDGSRVAQLAIYRGTYTVAGGKQHITVGSCIQYYIASKGTFELFPVGTSDPSSFTVSVRDNAISWSSPPGAAMILISVLDPSLIVDGQRTATLWQTLAPGTASKLDVSRIGLTAGHRYVATVGIADSKFSRMGFASTYFIAP